MEGREKHLPLEYDIVPGGFAFLISSSEMENACFQPDILDDGEQGQTRKVN
jgi:hypothetical protein